MWSESNPNEKGLISVYQGPCLLSLFLAQAVEVSENQRYFGSLV